MTFRDFCAVGFFLSSLVICSLMLFAEYRKLDKLESYFSKNDAVRDHKRFWNANQRIDRAWRMLLIVDLLSRPAFYVRRGEVTEAEVASVPVALRRWAVWPHNAGMIWAVAGGIGYFWFKP